MVLYGIFQQGSIICISRHVGGHALAWLHGEFHPGLKFQPGFCNKSFENQIVDYMEKDSARGAIQPGLKILARFENTGLGFSAEKSM